MIYSVNNSLRELIHKNACPQSSASTSSGELQGSTQTKGCSDWSQKSFQIISWGQILYVITERAEYPSTAADATGVWSSFKTLQTFKKIHLWPVRYSTIFH